MVSCCPGKERENEIFSLLIMQNPSAESQKKQKQKHDSASLGQTDTLTHFVHSGLFLR